MPRHLLRTLVICIVFTLMGTIAINLVLASSPQTITVSMGDQPYHSRLGHTIRAVLLDGRPYMAVGDLGNRLEAINRLNGKAIWTSEYFGPNLLGVAAMTDRTILTFSIDDCMVACLDKKSGKTLWTGQTEYYSKFSGYLYAYADPVNHRYYYSDGYTLWIRDEQTGDQVGRISRRRQERSNEGIGSFGLVCLDRFVYFEYYDHGMQKLYRIPLDAVRKPGDRIVDIAADEDGSYALREDGTVWTWGRYGQLGAKNSHKAPKFASHNEKTALIAVYSRG